MDNIEEKEKSAAMTPTESGGPAPQKQAEHDKKGADFVFPENMPKKHRRKGWIIAIAVVVVIVAAVLVVPRFLGKKPVMTAGAVTPYTVSRGDITETLSGSGTLKPADSYTVTSLIAGDILTAPFEEGDIVSKGQVLYTVDSSDVDNSIMQAQISVNNSQNQYNSALKQMDDLKLKAGGSGKLTKLSIKEGDTVQAGQTIATIQDYSVMELKILFQKETAESFYVGESANVSLDSSNDTYVGTVSDISTVDQIQSGNVIAREVTIKVTNPGAFAPTQSAYASINGMIGLGSAQFTYGYSGSVVTTLAGKVSQLNVKEGDQVQKDQVIAVLASDTLEQQVKSAKNALENAELTLDSQNNKITGYTIKSPIAGTIVEKIYKAGDKITVQTNQVLCTIFDLSYLTVTLNIDELDIGKVQPGQTVTVTAGAAGGKEYTGKVTKINIKGTTKNGVTSYPVTVQIDETEGLLPGMNVDAKIVVATMKDVLTVPTGAIMRNSFVLLKTGDPSAKSTVPGVPAGYTYTEVKLGPSNDTNIVVTEGLKEGDVVAVMDNTPSSYDYNPFGPERSESRSSDENSGDNSSEGSGGGGDNQTTQGSQSAEGAQG